jgi:hypothetical protein
LFLPTAAGYCAGCQGGFVIEHREICIFATPLDYKLDTGDGGNRSRDVAAFAGATLAGGVRTVQFACRGYRGSCHLVWGGTQRAGNGSPSESSCRAPKLTGDGRKGSVVLSAKRAGESLSHMVPGLSQREMLVMHSTTIQHSFRVFNQGLTLRCAVQAHLVAPVRSARNVLLDRSGQAYLAKARHLFFDAQGRSVDTRIGELSQLPEPASPGACTPLIH